MSSVQTYLRNPVTATVVKSFGSFTQGEMVQISWVTQQGRIFGLANGSKTIPRGNVDQVARGRVLRDYNAIASKAAHTAQVVYRPPAW